jgi:hypothetical protein
MKIVILSVLILCTLIFGSVTWETKAAKETRRQTAVTSFPRAVILNGVTLKPGQYLFVHDDAAMNRGEACTYVYKGVAPVPDKLVVSFHCVPVERAKATSFMLRSSETSGVIEVLEFQFAGDTESHAVPQAHAESHVVPTSVP